jgi:hypothetical protein
MESHRRIYRRLVPRRIAHPIQLVHMASGSRLRWAELSPITNHQSPIIHQAWQVSQRFCPAKACTGILAEKDSEDLCNQNEIELTYRRVDKMLEERAKYRTKRSWSTDRSLPTANTESMAHTLPTTGSTTSQAPSTDNRQNLRKTRWTSKKQTPYVDPRWFTIVARIGSDRERGALDSR